MIEPLPDDCLIEEGEEWDILTTPFLDPSFDYLQIYAKEADNGWLLSDMGECETYLWMHGYSIEQRPKLAEFIEHTIRHTGIANGEGDFGLTIVSKDKSREEFLKAYHVLVSSMLQIMHYVVYRAVYSK